MKKLIFIFAAVALSLSANAQCETRIHEATAKKVFNLSLNQADFSKSGLFMTLDTINSHDKNAPSSYFEYESAEPLIKSFVKFMESKEFEAGYFNYYELFDNYLYRSPLHQSFMVNDKTNTYKIDIWNNAKDITKIDGITIAKYPMKLERTPY